MSEVLRGSLFALAKDQSRESDTLSRLGRFLRIGKESSGDKKEIEIAEMRNVEPRDYLTILRWLEDSDTQGHLSPLPKFPDWKNEDQVAESIHELGQYYTNKGEPEKITALAAVNSKDKPLGVATIRWRGDPYAPKGHKVAMIERLVVNPSIRGKGVGRRLVEVSLREIFEGEEYREARVWVMSDKLARGWGRVIEFFHQFGFDQLQGEDHSWEDYQKRRDMVYDGRDAKQLVLRKETWDEKKKTPIQPEFVPSAS